jgi:putative DNA primase/helicase
VRTTALTELLDAALESAKHAPVFPVYGIVDGRCECGRATCDKNSGKHPHAELAPHGFKDATSDPATIRAWWARAPRGNIGTPTSWCAVLDVDPRHGGDETLAELERVHGSLPDTAEVLTGGGGRHLYFAPVPGLQCKNGIAPGLDIKADGGYVLLPPSNHKSGRPYLDEILHPLFDTPLAPMPAWLLAMAVSHRNGHEEPTSAETDWAALLQGAPDGARHATALRIAGHYFGKRLATSEVETILLGYAARCVPPFDASDVRRIVRDLAAKDAARASSAGVTVDPDVLRMPPLPAAEPAPAVIVASPVGFISKYVTVAAQRTDAPTASHQLAAVGLLSALAGPRVRLKLAYRADGVRLVLWTMNLVDSTSGRKTTVLEFALEVIRHVLGELAVLPWKGSPEALIQALAARDRSTAVFARDEYSGLLAQMKRGGYVAGLAQDFIRAYDGLPIVMARTAKMNRKTGERVDDTDRVHDPYLVKLCAATRTAFIATATIEDVLDGLLARFVFSSGSAEEQRMRPMTRTLDTAWRSILAAASAYHAQAADVLEIGLPDSVLDREWQLEQRLKEAALGSGRPDAARPAMKRLAETVLKVSALLALERAEAGSASITDGDWEAAEALAAPWERATLAVVADIGRTRFQARSDAVLGTIRAHPKGIMLSALYRAHRDLGQREFDEVLGALETQQLAHSVEAKTGKPGRTPVVYFSGPPTEPV